MITVGDFVFDTTEKGNVQFLVKIESRSYISYKVFKLRLAACIARIGITDFQCLCKFPLFIQIDRAKKSRLFAFRNRSAYNIPPMPASIIPISYPSGNVNELNYLHL